MSARDGEALSTNERMCQDGTDVAVLDVVDVPLLKHKPHSCQVENHLTDPAGRWTRVRRIHARDLLTVPVSDEPLWIDRFSSSRGSNDEVPELLAAGLGSSLRLVSPADATFRVTTRTSQSGQQVPQLRLRFRLRRTQYDFVVTDPTAQTEYQMREGGEYPAEVPLLVCVSLGEPLPNGNRYKLAAGVIPVLP